MAYRVSAQTGNFSTAATTGLAGEVTKGINAAKTAVNIIKNPISGTLNALGDAAEKLQNITPEAKQALLDKFIK